MPIDQYRDPVLATLARIVANRPKVAAAVGGIDIDPGEGETLPDHAYAWPEKRAYPVHTRDHALLSRAYREVEHAVPAHVDKALKQACEAYDIDESLFAQEKTASQDDQDDYLLPSLRRLPVVTAGQAKAAETSLLTSGGRLSPGHRMQANDRLVQKMARFGQDAPDPRTLQASGRTTTATQELVGWIEARHEAAPPGHKEAYASLAKEVRALPPEFQDRPYQVRLAAQIETLDEQSGLDCHWSRRLPDPLMTVFNTTRVAGAGVTLAGKFVPLERLANLSPETLSDVLGPDILREATDAAGQLDPGQLAEVLATLPADMQRVIAAHIPS